jgi:hypothetical protein
LKFIVVYVEIKAIYASAIHKQRSADQWQQGEFEFGKTEL